MKIVTGKAGTADEVLKLLRHCFDGRPFVYRPAYLAHLEGLQEQGAGEHCLALDRGEPVAVLFVRREYRQVMPVLLTDDQVLQRRALTTYFEGEGSRISLVQRPGWDLRVGRSLIPLFEACGFHAGPAEVLFRLLRSEYQSGYRVRDALDGSRVDYRMHDRDIAGTLATLTPLLQAWSGFYGLEGHSEETCRLFTASVDAQKSAVLWVLLPSRCGQEQNDCYLHWKEAIGDSGIFVRSTVTEDPFRGKGLGSSLHRFMLSRFFEGPGAVESSWISTNEENRPSVGLLESLGYRRQLVCRYHHFIR